MFTRGASNVVLPPLEEATIISQIGSASMMEFPTMAAKIIRNISGSLITMYLENSSKMSFNFVIVFYLPYLSFLSPTMAEDLCNEQPEETVFYQSNQKKIGGLYGLCATPFYSNFPTTFRL